MISVPRRDLIVPRRVPRREEEFVIDTSSNTKGVKLQGAKKREEKKKDKTSTVMRRAQVKENPSETESEDSD